MTTQKTDPLDPPPAMLSERGQERLEADLTRSTEWRTPMMIVVGIVIAAIIGLGVWFTGKQVGTMPSPTQDGGTVQTSGHK